ncbi:glutamate-gated chloride channel isoform X13 [Athalia rosae]|uniref:glutamate-gated chloride channel isoform X13 n=1 Tax=Athalia rosae TaxID=37344 RepID=UPI000DE7FC8D|nr:glutamate-gated chloride channel isoform X13 [Athalia rosae]
MVWVALGRRAAGGGSRPPVSPLLSLSIASLAGSFTLAIICILALTLTLTTLAHAEDIFEEGKSDKEILDNLLLSTRYDKRLLPPVQDADFCCGMRQPSDVESLTNQSASPRNPNQNKNLNNIYMPHENLRTHLRGTLTVNVSVLLLSLASPDESSLKYEVEFLLQQQWYDPRLRYSNRSSYEFLNAIHHHNDIWLPDTYFIMHGDFKDPLIPVHFALRIYRNGTVNYLMRRHLILSCQGRLNIFPFDDPMCSFAIESISYEQTAITYVWKNDEGTLRKSPSLTTLNAYLIQNRTIPCPIKASWRGNYSCLKVDLIFTRDRAFYFTTVFIPGIILVTSSFITFWLEWNAVPARVMIGVTTMLNFFTTSNGFRSTLPVVSNLTAMNVWDGVCMCFIYASLLEFVCVNYVGRKRPLHNVVYRPGENPVTQRLPAVLSRIGIILASPLGDKKREGGGSTVPGGGGGGAPNEIVTCTNCGPNPCTHTATNGCAAECCFVQVRKKEPPHPIRVAKTIDVIARITFPTAYAVFLVFFFIHYKGFS